MNTLDFLCSILLLSFAAIVGIAYLVRVLTKGRLRFERVENQGGSKLLRKSMMESVYWIIQPLEKALSYLGATPDLLTWASLFLGAGAGALWGMGYLGIGAFVTTLAGLFDILDGALARHSGKTTKDGKILDSSLDRYVEFFLFVGIAWYYHNIPPISLLALVAMFGGFMVSYSTALSEIVQVELPRCSMRRPERIVSLILGATLCPLFIRWLNSSLPMIFSICLIAFLANYTAALRIGQLRRQLRTASSKVITPEFGRTSEKSKLGVAN